MSRWVSLGVTLALVMLPASAFCQAAAESVLLNGAASSSAVKAGSAMNSALNGASKRIAGRVPQVSQASAGASAQPAREIEVKNGAASSVVPAGSVSQSGSMISSVQGTGAHCAPVAVNSHPADDKAQREAAPANCQSASVKPAPPEKYKSVVNLALPK